MKLQSLGLNTDLIFIEGKGIIEDKGKYVLVKSPKNPRWHWGNFLIFKEAPAENSFQEWNTYFEDEFSDLNVEHRAFAWDNLEEGNVSEFIENGCSFEGVFTLATNEVNKTHKHNSDIVVKPIITDSEWEQAYELQVLCRDQIYSEEIYRQFKKPQMEEYRDLYLKGKGHWFGAFLNGEIVGDLGIFHGNVSGKPLGRFQNVGTHPNHRRKGICSTLVYEASMQALESYPIDNLVMIADSNYHAAEIYKSVGFKEVEKMYSLYQRNRPTKK